MAALLTGGALLAASLFNDTSTKIDEMSKKAADNSVWMISQLDTEFQRTHTAVALYLLGDASLDEVVERLDILFSRAQLIDSPTLSELHSPVVQGTMKVSAMGAINLMDGWIHRGADKREGSAILREIELVSEEARDYAVKTVHAAATRYSEQKRELSEVESAAQVSFYGVLATMFLTLVWLLWQIRESQALAERVSESAAKLQLAVSESQRANSAKSDFLASMSHELRTPLNAVIGLSDMMRKEIWGPLGSAEYADYVDDIGTSGRHLLALVNDILDLAKIESGHFELFEEEVVVADEVRVALGFVAPSARQRAVALDVTGCTDDIVVRADRRRLRQIVTNLVSNAVKFTPAGGEVVVQCLCSRDGISLSVSDTGCGMTEKQILSALQLFSQVCNDPYTAKEGTGLGLPLAKRLVESHGATLKIESSPGKGTKATVHFPPYRGIAGCHDCS